MKRLCYILGVVGIISLASAKLIDSYSDVLEQWIPAQKEINEKNIQYYEDLDKLYYEIN